MSAMMNVNSTKQDPVAAAVVRCAKCGRENPGGQKLCQHCGAKLYVVCRRCRAVNERINQNCTSCGSHLHGSSWRRRGHGLFKRVSPLVAFLCVIALVLLVVLVWTLTSGAVAVKPPSEAPVQVDEGGSPAPDVSF
jgi:hypothetical protein